MSSMLRGPLLRTLLVRSGRPQTAMLHRQLSCIPSSFCNASVQSQCLRLSVSQTGVPHGALGQQRFFSSSSSNSSSSSGGNDAPDSSSSSSASESDAPATDRGVNPNLLHVPEGDESLQDLSTEEQIARSFRQTMKLFNIPSGDYEWLYRRVLANYRTQDMPDMNDVDGPFGSVEISRDMTFTDFTDEQMKKLVDEAEQLSDPGAEYVMKEAEEELPAPAQQQGGRGGAPPAQDDAAEGEEGAVEAAEGEEGGEEGQADAGMQTDWDYDERGGDSDWMTELTPEQYERAQNNLRTMDARTDYAVAKEALKHHRLFDPDARDPVLEMSQEDAEMSDEEYLRRHDTLKKVMALMNKHDHMDADRDSTGFMAVSAEMGKSLPLEEAQSSSVLIRRVMGTAPVTKMAAKSLGMVDQDLEYAMHMKDRVAEHEEVTDAGVDEMIEALNGHEPLKQRESRLDDDDEMNYAERWAAPQTEWADYTLDIFESSPTEMDNLDNWAPNAMRGVFKDNPKYPAMAEHFDEVEDSGEGEAPGGGEAADGVTMQDSEEAFVGDNPVAASLRDVATAYGAKEDDSVGVEDDNAADTGGLSHDAHSAAMRAVLGANHPAMRSFADDLDSDVGALSDDDEQGVSFMVDGEEQWMKQSPASGYLRNGGDVHVADMGAFTSAEEFQADLQDSINFDSDEEDGSLDRVFAPVLNKYANRDAPGEFEDVYIRDPISASALEQNILMDSEIASQRKAERELGDFTEMHRELRDSRQGPNQRDLGDFARNIASPMLDVGGQYNRETLDQEVPNHATHNVYDPWDPSGFDDADETSFDPRKHSKEFTDRSEKDYQDKVNSLHNVKSHEVDLYEVPEPWEVTYRLSEQSKRQMYDMHREDPTRYHARTLAPIFGVSTDRAYAILVLQALEFKAEQMGLPSMETPELAKGRLLRWPARDNVFDPGMPLLSKPSADFRFADDESILTLEETQRRRQVKLMNKRDRLIETDADYYKHAGFIGEKGGVKPKGEKVDVMNLDTVQKQPAQLDDSVAHPTRWDWVMVDISDSANSNYSIAVRDKNGLLREPNSEEFSQVRKTERTKREPFYYVQYQQHYDPKIIENAPMKTSEKTVQRNLYAHRP